MKLQAITPILNVSNLEVSFAWFEALGWRRLWDWGDPPDFGAVGSGACEIFLCLDGQGSRGGPLPRLTGGDAAGGVWMSWWVESPAAVDDLWRLALDRGVQVVQPPHDMPWGVRECHIRHPDGHAFRVSAGTPEAD